MTHHSHRTRVVYATGTADDDNEVCALCGATDADGGTGLDRPCPDALPEDRDGYDVPLPEGDRAEMGAFLQALAEDPYDRATHYAFSDWLSERGLDDLAGWHRSWTPERQQGEDWLRDLARRGGRTCVNYDRTYNYDNPQDVEEPLYRTFSLEDIIQAGHAYVRERDYLVQQGDDVLRNLFGTKGMAELYWKHWSAYTGQKPPKPGGYGPEAPFSCSC